MSWQQLKINVTSGNAEHVGDLLSELGSQAVTFVDAKDTPVYEPKPGETFFWPDTQVIGLFNASVDINPIVSNVIEACKEVKEFTYFVDQLEDKDWEREWMDNFHPMPFGDRLWICPSWRSAPDPKAVNILLDPGLAFGTGTHPTTSLCLKWLDGQDLEGKTVVDFGCGSGILGIAALKLGALKVIGIDIDPQALLASADNAKRNGVEKRLELYLPKNQPKIEAELVLANILSGPLRELSNTISSYCMDSGHLVMSGILSEQAHEVMECYQEKFNFDPIAIDTNWVRLSATKEKNKSSIKTNF
jgi:ribosomal protein L11 methyltransferase